MRLLVLGSTGGTGSAVVTQGLADGHTITAFTRHPEKVALKDSNLTVAKGDANDIASLVAAMQGQDAVVVAIGPKSIMGASQLATTTTRNIIAAMQQTGVKRVILLSSYLVLRPQLSLGAKFAADRILKAMIKDKAAGEQLLRDSDLDWTIVHATRLTDGPKADHFRRVLAGERLGVSNSISRADVASALLSLLNDPRTRRENIPITSR